MSVVGNGSVLMGTKYLNTSVLGSSYPAIYAGYRVNLKKWFVCFIESLLAPKTYISTASHKCYYIYQLYRLSSFLSKGFYRQIDKTINNWWQFYFRLLDKYSKYIRYILKKFTRGNDFFLFSALVKQKPGLR